MQKPNFSGVPKNWQPDLLQGRARGACQAEVCPGVRVRHGRSVSLAWVQAEDEASVLGLFCCGSPLSGGCCLCMQGGHRPLNILNASCLHMLQRSVSVSQPPHWVQPEPWAGWGTTGPPLGPGSPGAAVPAPGGPWFCLELKQRSQSPSCSTLRVKRQPGVLHFMA